MLGSPTFTDPEALFHSAVNLARIGRHDRATEVFARTVDRGYAGLPALDRLRRLDPLRTRADFRAVAERADEQRRAAEDAFVLSGGERVLGVAAG